MIGPEHEAIAAEWVSKLDAMDASTPPAPGLLFSAWPAVRRIAIGFARVGGAHAAALRWSTCELFGVHRTVGALRVDATGALITVSPMRVVDVTEYEIRYSNGLVARRKFNHAESVPVWDYSGRRA